MQISADVKIENVWINPKFHAAAEVDHIRFTQKIPTSADSCDRHDHIRNSASNNFHIPVARVGVDVSQCVYVKCNTKEGRQTGNRAWACVG